jgi:hypothetical protein
MFEPEHLKRWKMPRCYFGAEWPSYFVFVGQTRDSDCLERSNFRVALRLLEEASATFNQAREAPFPELDEEGIITPHEHHWACGWVEWIGIHEDNEVALRLADQMAAGLEDYAIIDEEDFSDLECEEANEVWRNLSVGERVHVITKWARGVSLFAARREEFPSDDCGRIQERLLMPGGGIL